MSELKPLRLMPDEYDLGRQYQTPIVSLTDRYEKWCEAGRPADPLGRRMVMGFALPTWQRGLVWNDGQKVRFIESIWRGLYLGTYTYNDMYHVKHLDDILIDGQQRLWSLQCYLEDEFPVFGYRWSETTEVDKRMFGMSRIFGSFVTRSTDENYLRGYYDMMNFGGTAHTEDQRATATKAPATT